MFQLKPLQVNFRYFQITSNQLKPILVLWNQFVFETKLHLYDKFIHFVSNQFEEASDRLYYNNFTNLNAISCLHYLQAAPIYHWGIYTCIFSIITILILCFKHKLWGVVFIYAYKETLPEVGTYLKIHRNKKKVINISYTVGFLLFLISLWPPLSMFSKCLQLAFSVYIVNFHYQMFANLQ